MRDRDHGTCLTDETLTDYLEGALDLPLKAASEVHLVSCEDCRNQLALLMLLLEPRRLLRMKPIRLNSLLMNGIRRQEPELERRKGSSSLKSWSRLLRLLLSFWSPCRQLGLLETDPTSRSRQVSW